MLEISTPTGLEGIILLVGSEESLVHATSFLTLLPQNFFDGLVSTHHLTPLSLHLTNGSIPAVANFLCSNVAPTSLDI